jgi:hypothetical protein
MSGRASGSFKGQAWKEHNFSEFAGGSKLANADETNSYTGAIEGEGRVQYLIHYKADGTVSFDGLEQVTGRLEGRSGSFVLRHSGEYAAGQVSCRWTVLPGSATGELAGLRAEGSFTAAHPDPAEYTLAYELA